MKVLAFLLLLVSLVFAQNTKYDPINGVLVVENYEHYELHEGSHFTYSAEATVGDADTLGVLIQTPNTTKWAHMIVDVTGALDTKVEIFENPTHALGAELVAYNNNRNSTDTCTTQIYTFTRAGGVDSTAIFVSHFGIDAGVGAGRVTGGGGSRASQEWILKQNTRYLVAVISATAANIVSLKLSWYEHTNY